MAQMYKDRAAQVVDGWLRTVGAEGKAGGDACTWLLVDKVAEALHIEALAVCVALNNENYAQCARWPNCLQDMVKKPKPRRVTQ